MQTFGVRDDDDEDNDGLPDWWERRVGMTVGVADAALDPDGDGLTNLQEHRFGTLPLLADSDGGGETDGSEVAYGRDPKLVTDDGVQPHSFQVTAGNGRVFVRPDLPSSLVQFVVERVERGASGMVCYRVRTMVAAAESSWASVKCVTPKADPLAPWLSLNPIYATNTRQFSLPVPATDEARLMGAHAPADVDATAAASGVGEVRVSTRGDFQGAPWVAYTPEVALWLPDATSTTYYVQVRDRAGNLSRVISTEVRREDAGPLDHAIVLEERALDALAAGDYTKARAAITTSIPSIRAAVDQLRVPGCSPARWVLSARLLGVAGRKIAATALTRPATKPQAERMLREALDDERDISGKLATTR